MKIKLFILIVNFFALFYLFTPFPEAPDLPNSVRSPEPGDNGQISNLKAFFTDDYRATVMTFFYNKMPKPYILINHPPERAKQVYRDTMQSYYLEEFVFPFKGSIYINGYEWENDVFTKPDQRQSNKMLIGTREFKSKVSIRWFPAPIPLRILNLIGLNIALIAIYNSLKIVLNEKK